MISLEQWRAAVGGWNSRNLRAIYRRYGSRRMVRARDWARFQLAMELYSVDVYCSLYWLIVGLFAFFSSDGWRSATFDDICDFPLAIRRALTAAPTILVRHASHDNLPQLCALASPTAAPELRSSIVYLQRLWKLESPSVSSILRLLRALGWLLIVAGDVELNPGPVTPELAKLLKTTNVSVLKEDDLLTVYHEVLDLAPNWMFVGLMLGLRHTHLKEISTTYRERPRECLMEALAHWLKQAYDVERNGLPTWKKMVEVTADSKAGNNPALAVSLAQNHQGKVSTARSYPKQAELSTDPFKKVISVYVQYLRGRYQAQIPTFFTLQWPPPPTRKIFNLAMIRGQTIRFGCVDEDMVRLTLRGKIRDVIFQKSQVELKDIMQLDSAKRKVILIEGGPGSGKSTLAWYVCQTWESEKLFQNFRTVVYIQLRDPTIQSAKSVEDIIPAESRDQAEMVMAEFRKCRGQDLLLVMDGWDELPSNLHVESLFQKLIAFPETLNLHLSTVVITSRPIASSDLYHCISSRVEILGFTPTEVKDYFTEVLGGESQAIQKLQNQLKERPLIAASCYLPLNAAIVCHLFRAQDYKLPTTLHELFTLLVLGCLKRHVAKQKRERERQRITSLNNLPLDLQQFFKDVCTLAYHGVMNNCVTFPLEYLKTHGLPTISETLGLMQGMESFTTLESSPSFYFLHLSVQELLASFYISKLPAEEQALVFKKLFREPRFAAVFRFFTAFTKLETDGLRKIVASIVQGGDKSQLLYLFHGMYEAQAPSLCQFVGSQLGGELDLSATPLSPVDSLTLGYFISCICLTTVGEFKAVLQNCSLDDYRITFFVKELSKCTSSAITQKAMLAVLDAGLSSGLELTLDLWNNDVGAEGAALLCGGSIYSLKTLDLCYNALGAEGCTALAEALKNNQYLTTLYLWHNGITEEGARAIMEALKTNKTLTTLDLRFNPIQAAHGDIAAALSVNHTLTCLKLPKDMRGLLDKEFTGRIEYSLW